MHLSVKLIFTLAEPDDNNSRGDTHQAEGGTLIGSHQLGITKSTCHPRGFSNQHREAPAMGPTGPGARLTQTFHPYCQPGLLMPHSLASLV